MNGKKPKILLVQPTTVHLDGTPHKTRWRLIMGLMIPLMAGLTPDEYDVTLCDERLEEINFDGGWDLVGMTTTIGASLRAYQLGDEFRKRGIPVVFGGFHATLQTEEALHHCDAVVKGEADLVWPELLQDWRDGKLKQIYKADKVHDLKNLPRPRHELLKLNRYLFKAVPVQASRGCPYRCSFCEIPVFYDGAYRTRPIEDINFDGGWDLVGMTTTIGASLRAYQLGDEFRKRGIPVVFGGFHATLQTEEALH
ncbi:MAG: hypothetical protein WBQ86_21550, partial [Candidatus Binatus sp.]